MARRRAAKTIDELLTQARATLPDRPSPAEALHAQASGALLIDIREDDQRRADGLIPGAIVLPRNSLEWRCDPASQWRHPAITRRDLRIILICNQGYQSTLAAATLQQLGLMHATDLDGGFTAWAAAGLPVIAPATAGHHRPATVIPGGQHAGLFQPGARDGARADGQRAPAARCSGAAVGDVRGAARGRRAGVILQARPLIEGPGHRVEEAAERPHLTPRCLRERLLDAVVARDVDGVDPIHRRGHRGPVCGQRRRAAGGPRVEGLRLGEHRPRGAGR